MAIITLFLTKLSEIKLTLVQFFCFLVIQYFGKLFLDTVIEFISFCTKVSALRLDLKKLAKKQNAIVGVITCTSTWVQSLHVSKYGP